MWTRRGEWEHRLETPLEWEICGHELPEARGFVPAAALTVPGPVWRLSLFCPRVPQRRPLRWRLRCKWFLKEVVRKGAGKKDGELGSQARMGVGGSQARTPWGPAGCKVHLRVCPTSWGGWAFMPLSHWLRTAQLEVNQGSAGSLCIRGGGSSSPRARVLEESCWCVYQKHGLKWLRRHLDRAWSIAQHASVTAISIQRP